MAFVKKQVSGKNREERVAFGYKHANALIEEFWSHIVYTDEIHVDPSLQAVRDIL